METDEQRAMFIANEIGAAMIDLIANGMDVNRPQYHRLLGVEAEGCLHPLQRCVAGCCCVGAREKIRGWSEPAPAVHYLADSLATLLCVEPSFRNSSIVSFFTSSPWIMR
ncbi:Uncharacterised protein [Serratia odorifera]|uniref:Uncharacterized protein n=1 Tax=Serratia odorifera TaxID=618 RepID=A0A3S4DSH1_SEROD|nr:Uncharacterised protein [Serratia odorifera]